MIDHSAKIITGENLCNNLSIIGDGYTVRDCNLSQRNAHTTILSSVAGLRFEECNLKNCDLPSDATIKDCLIVHEDIVDKQGAGPDVKMVAMRKFEEIKPLAYQDPVAVNDALNTVYTPEEINGVLSARVD